MRNIGNHLSDIYFGYWKKFKSNISFQDFGVFYDQCVKIAIFNVFRYVQSIIQEKYCDKVSL